MKRAPYEIDRMKHAVDALLLQEPNRAGASSGRDYGRLQWDE
jgi:hypothetical protein